MTAQRRSPAGFDELLELLSKLTPEELGIAARMAAEDDERREAPRLADRQSRPVDAGERIGAKEAAAILGVKPRKLQAMSQRGEIPASRGSAANGPTTRRNCAATSNNRKR